MQHSEEGQMVKDNNFYDDSSKFSFKPDLLNAIQPFWKKKDGFSWNGFFTFIESISFVRLFITISSALSPLFPA